MERQHHILVVDDDADILETLSEHLERNGFLVTSASNAQEARNVLAGQVVDLVILDIMMPGESGLSLCRHLSETTNILIVVLSAFADDTDRIVGLEVGADDYITKPFNPRELIARVRAALRRAKKGYTAPGESAAQSQNIVFDKWRLNSNTGELFSKNQPIISLSRGESRLLKIFFDNAGQTLTREDLFNLTKGRDGHAFERSIDSLVSRLRHKLEVDPKNPKYIKTVWGDGYLFSVESGAC